MTSSGGWRSTPSPDGGGWAEAAIIGGVPSTYKGRTVPSYSDTADIVTAFQNFIDDGSGTPTFASAAARDAAITSPTVGEMCYLDDVGHLTVYHGGSTGWARDWSAAWGWLGEGNAPGANSQGVFAGTPVWINGTDFTVQMPAKRRYQIVYRCYMLEPTSPNNADMRIQIGINGAISNMLIKDGINSGELRMYAGTHYAQSASSGGWANYTFQMRCENAAGNNYVVKDYTGIAVYDAGPAGGPV